MSLSEKLYFSARVPSGIGVTAVHLMVETLHTWGRCFVRKRCTPIVDVFLDPERHRETHGNVDQFDDCRFSLNEETIEILNQRSLVKMKVKSHDKTILKYFIDAESLIERLQNHSKFSSLHVTLTALETQTASTVEVTGERQSLTSKPLESVSESSSGRESESSTLRRHHQWESLTASLTPQYKASPGQYEVRVIVWRVAEISRRVAKEFFPDIYFKVRMTNPRSEWRLTDVHESCMKSQALFNYRILLPPFQYPAPARKVGLLRRLQIHPPTLEVVMMDRDDHTRDDYMGRVTLNLEDMCVPDDLEGCGINTLTNKRVNLFHASALQPLRDSKAVFPRELTGYWPVTMGSNIPMRSKRGQTASLLMTIQLLSAQEAAEHPVVQGNRSHPLNRFPTLTKPSRKHGKFSDLVIFGLLEKIENVVNYVTGIPSLKMAFWLGVITGYLIYNLCKMKTKQLKAIALPVGTAVCIMLVGFYILAWLLQKNSGTSQKPRDHSSSQNTRSSHFRTATQRTGSPRSQSRKVSLSACDLQPLNTRCKHFLSYLACEECRPKLNDRQCQRIKNIEVEERKKLRKKRRKRIKTLNDELLQDNKDDKPQRSPKLHFDLEGLPLPIKDRELLYEEYQDCNVGMQKQWESRLKELRGNKPALREELNRKAHSVQRFHPNRGPPPRQGQPRAPAVRHGWGSLLCVACASVIVFGMLSLPRLYEKWTSPTATRPP